MAKQLTKAQIIEQLEAALVRNQALEQRLAVAERHIAEMARPQRAAPQITVPSANRRYTKADGRVFEVIKQTIGQRVIATHKFVGMSWEQ